MARSCTAVHVKTRITAACLSHADLQSSLSADHEMQITITRLQATDLVQIIIAGIFR